jgi:hypothetical protein
MNRMVYLINRNFHVYIYIYKYYIAMKTNNNNLTQGIAFAAAGGLHTKRHRRENGAFAAGALPGLAA